MLIKAENSKIVRNSLSCVVQEYDFSNPKVGLARAKINGRYPDSGKAINRVCDEAYFILAGQGSIHNKNGDFEVKEGDAFLLKKGEYYWVNGKELDIVVFSSPAWYFEQYLQTE